MLPDYLWGIETRVSIKLLDSCYSASRLPMRNWNRGPLQEWWWTCYRFQTTYEELKLFQTSIASLLCKSELPDYLWGIETIWRETGKYSQHSFQTTYEELKLVGGKSARPMGKGFQTTYEELKRKGLEKSVIINLASRLPMRNWNLTMTVMQLPSIQASRLPMRNWNTAP